MNSELIKRAREIMQETTAEAGQIIVQDAPMVNVCTLLAEHDDTEVVQIAALWRRLFGFSESPVHIKKSLGNLRHWQTRAKRGPI
jgi:hypothetical protein